MRHLWSAVPVLSLALLACGGSEKSTPDAKVISTIDAANTPTPDAPAAACTVSTTSFGDKGALTGNAEFDDQGTAADTTDDSMSFVALLESAQPADGIQVQLYAGYGAFKTTPIAAGTYQITGDELNFATCGICVLRATNATSSGYDDDYMATGGTVTITATGKVGETFSGTLSNLTFEHVTIDQTSFESTPVGDSCTSGLTNATFSATLAAPMAAKVPTAVAPRRHLGAIAH